MSQAAVEDAIVEKYGDARRRVLTPAIRPRRISPASSINGSCIVAG